MLRPVFAIFLLAMTAECAIPFNSALLVREENLYGMKKILTIPAKCGCALEIQKVIFESISDGYVRIERPYVRPIGPFLFGVTNSGSRREPVLSVDLPCLPFMDLPGLRGSGYRKESREVLVFYFKKEAVAYDVEISTC